MASGHVNRSNRPNTWRHRPATRREDFPCQPEPSTHGTDRLFQPVAKDFRCWRLTDGAGAVPAVGRNRCSSRWRGTVLHQPSDLWLSSSRIAGFGDCLAQCSSKVRGRENSELMVLD